LPNMNETMTNTCLDLNPATLTTAWPASPGNQCSDSVEEPAQDVRSSELLGGQEALAESASTSGVSEDDKPWLEEPPWKAKREHTNRRQKERNWLMAEPEGWVGRKVRSLRKFGVYTVSEVYKTGRVKLERNWMTYLTDVRTVRSEYEPHW